MNPAAPLTVDELAQVLGGQTRGDGARAVEAIAPLERAGPRDVSFAVGARQRSALARSRAGCVLIPATLLDALPREATAVVVPDAYLAYARLTQFWRTRQAGAAPSGVHPSAVIDASARVDPSAWIGPQVVIGARACIHAGVFIDALCAIGDDAVIGAGTRLAARVTVSYGCRIGARTIIHSGAVIGADGFGFAPHAGAWEKIEQFGAVQIGDEVEIGANTCVDRGALSDTVIEDGVKLDNLIQIGHNVRVGRGTAMAACVGVAGSAVIGKGCTIGGGAGITGHIELADGVHVSAFTMISRSIHEPGVYSGVYPFEDNASWEKNAATLRRLHLLRERLRALERQVKP